MRVYVFIILFFPPYPLIMLQERRLERERGTSYLRGVLIANSDYISPGGAFEGSLVPPPPPPPRAAILHL